MEEYKQCPKCNGEMEEGYMHDSQNTWFDLITKKVQWVRGGKNLDKALNTQSKLPISTYRCKQCGYLENYAESSNSIPFIRKIAHNRSETQS